MKVFMVLCIVLSCLFTFLGASAAIAMCIFNQSAWLLLALPVSVMAGVGSMISGNLAISQVLMEGE